jgi:fumarylpyruvate hydrolase
MTSSSTAATNVKYAVSPPAVPTVPIVNTTNVKEEGGEQKEEVFPVHRIYCVGRNYAEHSIEMGGDPNRETPFFFCKPADAIVPCGCDKSSASSPSPVTQIPYPLATHNLHHEIELVVAIGKGGTMIDVQSAESHIFGYAIGVDLTRRDLQKSAKEHSRPWCTAKAFDRSAPIGNIYPKSKNLQNKQLWLNVNGQRRQTGHVTQMIWSVPEIVSILSQYFALQPGDLIFTGTPAGVAALEPGDTVAAGMDGLGELAFSIK